MLIEEDYQNQAVIDKIAQNNLFDLIHGHPYMELAVGNIWEGDYEKTYNIIEQSTAY